MELSNQSRIKNKVSRDKVLDGHLLRQTDLKADCFSLMKNVRNKVKLEKWASMSFCAWGRSADINHQTVSKQGMPIISEVSASNFKQSRVPSISFLGAIEQNIPQY